MTEFEQFMSDAFTCIAIEAITAYGEAVIGVPGPDGEDPLANWKPTGILSALKDFNGELSSE